MATNSQRAKERTKLISIRLQKSLIADLKVLARCEGIRYQTLIKQALKKALEERTV